jgi:hypothetical protein
MLKQNPIYSFTQSPISASCRSLTLPSFHSVGRLKVKQSMAKYCVRVRGQVGITLWCSFKRQIKVHVSREPDCVRLDGVHVPYLGDMNRQNTCLLSQIEVLTAGAEFGLLGVTLVSVVALSLRSMTCMNSCNNTDPDPSRSHSLNIAATSAIVIGPSGP